ncbi:hypothetical protein ACFQ61_09545 [Streptomyces sp. NPDC056500]|uniref:hypothetical protein n=1 Tax=Streptomyces sp. NPDC056500 TaxID=3345840 RepID=UPI00369F194F
MSELRALHAYFVHCVESSDKVGFSLRDGREFLGRVVESGGGPAGSGMAPGEVILPGVFGRRDHDGRDGLGGSGETASL